jgi:hypothetical protein
MRKLVITVGILIGLGLALWGLWSPGGPAADAEGGERGDFRQAQARPGAAQQESLEDRGVRGGADAGSTPTLAQPPSEEDGVLEVEVLAGQRPVPGAGVRLYWRGPRDPNLGEASWRLASARTTDEQGRARLASRPGGYLVAVRAQGYGLVLRDVVRPYGEARTLLRLSLEPGQSLTGRTVEAGTKDPLPLVELSLTAYGRGTEEAWQSVEAPAEERIYAQSDTRGDFRVDGLAPGSYLLEARAVGHVRAVQRRVRVPATGPLTVELQAAGVIEGFVVDGQGRPAAGAEVHVGGRVPEVVTTGAGGGFSVEVEPGDHIVSARRGSEAGSLASPIIVSAGKTVRDVRIQLGESAALEGHVVAKATGAPIEGARVDVSPYGNNGDSGRAVTDGAGFFSVGQLAPGSYDVMVSAQGYAESLRRALTVAAGERFSVEFQLAGTGTVEGFIRDSGGQPVPGAQVVSSNRWGGESGSTPMEARADAEGHYRLEGLPAGPLSLTARREGATIGVRHLVEVSEDATVTRDFTLEEPGTVEGKVIPAQGSLPTEPLVVLAYPRESTAQVPSDFRPLELEPTGTFRMTLQPGAYELRVALSERWPFGPSESKWVNVKGGGTVPVEVVWRGNSREQDDLQGTVVEPDGTPSPEAFVTVMPEEGVRGARMNAPTDAQGRFSFALSEEEAAVPNRLKLIARNGGRLGELRGVKPGERSLVVRLQPAVSLRGRVVRANGEPVKGFTLSVESQDLRSFMVDHQTLEFPGDRFEVRDAPSEPVRLTVRTKDGLGGSTVVTPGSGDVEITLKGTATVKGRVLDAATLQPLPGAILFVLEDRPLDPENATDAEGRFTLEGVGVGDRVLVILSGEEYQRVPVKLEEGAVKDVGEIHLGTP